MHVVDYASLRDLSCFYFCCSARVCRHDSCIRPSQKPSRITLTTTTVLWRRSPSCATTLQSRCNCRWLSLGCPMPPQCASNARGCPSPKWVIDGIVLIALCLHIQGCQDSDMCCGVDLESYMFLPFQYIVIKRNLFEVSQLTSLMNGLGPDSCTSPCCASQKLMNCIGKSDPDFASCESYIEHLDGLIALMLKSQMYASESEKLGDMMRKTYGVPKASSRTNTAPD